MFSPFNLIAAAVSIALLLGGYFTGRDAGRAAGEIDRAAERNRLLGEWQARVLDEVERADRIDSAAAQRATRLDKVLQETRHALKTTTAGRACLGGAALRVLDHAPGLRAPAPDPAAGALHDGSARAAADPAGEEFEDIATDTDVAGWIADAGALYERCRDRIRDIRAYEADE